MPVLGRFGTELSKSKRRFSASGVAGEPKLALVCPKLGLLVPGENIFFCPESEKSKWRGKVGGFGEVCE